MQLPNLILAGYISGLLICLLIQEFTFRIHILDRLVRDAVSVLHLRVGRVRECERARGVRRRTFGRRWLIGLSRSLLLTRARVDDLDLLKLVLIWLTSGHILCNFRKLNVVTKGRHSIFAGGLDVAGLDTDVQARELIRGDLNVAGSNDLVIEVLFQVRLHVFALERLEAS
jgi:hypothetical protein